MERLDCETVCLLMLALTVGCWSYSLQYDPCADTNHGTLTEVERSTGYQTQPNDSPLCDSHLPAHWYRFKNGAGDQMPTTCPNRLSCGTVVPVWMNGTHPTVDDGIVQRQACANYDDNSGKACCQHYSIIMVKNCGSFYVYYLHPPPSCSIAFCAGDKVPCPAGQWSQTGFAPCLNNHPILIGKPVLTGPHISQESSFTFNCTFQTNESHPDQRFEVIFFQTHANRHGQLSRTVVADPVRVVSLDGKLLKNHMNKKFACKVRSFYIGRENTTSVPRRSDGYFAGMQVSPSQLDISEADTVKKVKVSSTVPIICENNHPDCCILLKMAVQSAQELTIEQSCTYKMCSHHWNGTQEKAEISVPVLATRDLVRERGGRTRSLLTFEELLPTGGGGYVEIFEGLKPPEVPVVVDDSRTFTCVISGDPHIRQVDNRKKHIDLYTVGTFTAYESSSRDFQVQIRTWSCTNRHVACVCGVTVREGNNLIKINQCDQNRNGHVSPIVNVANQLSRGTKINRSRDGNTIEVLLSSGASIKIFARQNLMQVALTTPGIDHSSASGLCGTTDDVPSNDLTRPSGVVDLPCTPGVKTCQPTSFLDSWRTGNRNSLFDEVPALVPLPPEDESAFCSCAQRRPQGDCSYRKHVSSAIEKCHHCRDITNVIKPAKWGRGTKRNAQVYEDVDLPDVPYVETNTPVGNLNLSFPNDQGMTEKQARSMCQNALHNTPLWGECKNDDDMVDNVVADCVQDILISGGAEFVSSAAIAFSDLCLANVVEDPDNYDQGSDGDLTLKAQYGSKLCPEDCGDYGHCSGQTGGQCVCDMGWQGDLCHIQDGLGLQLDRIRSGPLCNLNERPCRKVFIDVSNLDLSDDLECAVTVTNAQGNTTISVGTTKAEYLSARRISCEIPSSEGATDIIGWSPPSASTYYRISASFDKLVFGNSLSLHVFDGACLDCNGGGCSIKPKTCHIDNVCHRHGAVSPHNERDFCDSDVSSTSWTSKPTAPPTNPPTTPPTTPPHPTPAMWLSLSGPSKNRNMLCYLHDIGDRVIGSDVKVRWLMDGQMVIEQPLTPKSTTAVVSIFDLYEMTNGHGGKLTCSVTIDGITIESGSIMLEVK